VRATRALGNIAFGAVADLIPAKVDGRDGLGVLRETARELAPDGTSRAVLVVDDAQFLDAGSVAVLQHLARVEVAFLVLTAGCEPRAGERTRGLWHEFGARSVRLGPLSLDEARVVVELGLGGRASERTIRLLHRQAGGNPLYLHELLGEARDQERLVQRHGVWSLSAPPQPSARLRGAVARSLAGLREDERRALELVCLAVRLPVATLNALAGTEATEDLERRQLVTTRAVGAATGGRELELACGLHGPIVRDELPAAREIALRRALAAELRRAEPGPDRDYRLAMLADDPAELGADVLCAAAKRALRLGDTTAAARFAALVATDVEHALDAVVTAARADVAAGRHAAAERVLAGHEDEALSTRRAGTYVDTKLSALLGTGAPLDHAERELRRLRAAATAGAAAPVIEDRLALLADLRAGRGGRASTAELPADPTLRAIAAVAAIEHHLADGRVGNALAAADDTLAALDLPEHPAGESELALLLAWVHAHLCSGTEWDACERRLADLVAAAGRDDALADAATLGRCRIALARGMAETASSMLDDAAAALHEHCPRLRPLALAELAHAHALAGRPDDCAAALTGASDGTVPAQLRFLWVQTTAVARSWAHAAQGRLSAARTVLHKELETLPANALSRLILLHHLVRLGEDPRPLATPLRALAETTGTAYGHAAAQHAAGLADDAAARLGEAATQFAAIGMQLVAAEAALQASTLYAAAGYPARSREYLTRTRFSLSRCEATLTPALMTADVEAAALTDREQEIAMIAARGLTNVQIAEQLSISVRTVESHLYRAMTKMGAGRRAQLGELLGVAA
jgi:DNA-binding CsgD family transcriptional regulator